MSWDPSTAELNDHPEAADTAAGDITEQTLTAAGEPPGAAGTEAMVGSASPLAGTVAPADDMDVVESFGLADPDMSAPGALTFIDVPAVPLVEHAAAATARTPHIASADKV